MLAKNKKILSFFITSFILFGSNYVFALDNDSINTSTIKQTTSITNNLYTDSAAGYSITVPSDMKLDASLSKIKTTFSNECEKIEIYYDDFRNQTIDYNTYIGYSNEFLKVPGHILDEKNSISLNGYDANILKWHRDKLASVLNDFNYYASAEIKKNEKEVYTIIIKSNSPITNFEEIINSFSILDTKTGVSTINKKFKVVDKNLNEQTQNFYDEYLGKQSNLKFGIFEPTAPKDMTHIHSLESILDYNFPVLVRYQNFDTPKIPISELENASKENKVVELTFQFFDKDKDSKTLTYDVLNGEYDNFFKDYARKLKAFENPILFRLNNEMNGDWCTYSSYYTSKDPDLFVKSWQHIHDIFEEEGVDNVLWVWNPNEKSFPNFNWNNYLNYYPGDEYVDVIGLTGYNTGTYYQGESWRSFDEIYKPLYAEYSRLFEQPLIITEFACASTGGNKAQWIDDMFKNLYKYPKIKLAIWWNYSDYAPSGAKARNYQLDESEEILSVFRKNLATLK